ncbi:uncharacterized protein LOC105771857 [Gossypium raimondii]|uniref:uncharacterized protein LOC105771857 n=1 Tax=Gossypium raimondii TaxID=29730 RepID=UPI00227B0256|nr:uncharacterized protein LOC105771857 [Gossypium raimondii]
MESTALNGRTARWQNLLSEFDIVYVSQKAIKGSAIADFLASRALEDYEPLNFDFSNEDLMYVASTEENPQRDHEWRLNFDGASNAIGNGIGAVLVSPSGDHYPVASKLDFDCTNNMAEYEACIMGIHAAIERNIKVLRVYGDSALVIYRLKGEWETKDPKLISYRRLVLELVDEFDDITFSYLPREENQMVGALATLASMIQVNRLEVMRPIQMSIYETPAYCYNIEEEGKDDHPWYQSILQYVKNQEYPSQATENDKITLRRLAIEYVLDGELDEAEWVQSRYDQLNLIEERRLRAIHHGKMYQKRMMRAYDKKEGPYVVKRVFSGGALILSEMDGKSLPNPVNADSVKRYFI